MPERLISRRMAMATAGAVVVTSAVKADAVKAEPARDGMDGAWDRESFTDRPAGRIHALYKGNGKPLVLLHKLGGWAADWRKVAPALAASGRQVIAIDLPGHGGSRMLGEPPYLQTVSESAAMIKAALDEMGVTRFDLAGCSLGGCTAVQMANFWPASVRRLVLLSVSLTGGVTRAELLKQDAIVEAGAYGPHGEPLPRTAAQTSKFGSLDPQVNIETNLSRAIAGRWVRPSERGVAVAGTAGYLPGVGAPTLLMYGDNGFYRQFEPVARAAIKDVSTVVIARSGSFTQQEQPDATAAAINGFLA